MSCIVSAVVAGMAALAPSQQNGERGQETTVMLSTDALIGHRVLNELGHENAFVKELMINPETGYVGMVVVALDGEQASTLAVPWSSLAVDRSGSLRLIGTEYLERTESTDEGADASSRVDGDDSTVRGESKIQIGRADSGGATVDAAQGSDDRSHVPNDRFSTRYDARSLVSFEGVVVGVVVAPMEGRAADVALVVEDAPGESMRVHLGPKWFVDQLGIDVEPGDFVAVTGSSVTNDERIVVLAAELTANAVSVALRQADGTPLW